MALALIGGAVLDSLLAPVRTVTWSSSWLRGRRAVGTSVLVIAFLVGTPYMVWSGHSQAYFWIWVVLRLFSDVNTLRLSERERLRLHFLGPDAKVV